MKPEVDKVLTGFSGTIISKLMPELKSEYAQRDASLLSLALTAAAEEYDRAADTRVAENHAMREIFAEAAAHISDADLKSRLKESSAERDQSFRIKDLNTANARYRTLLIELHALVEKTDADWAREINRMIWAALRDSTRRRSIAFFPL